MWLDPLTYHLGNDGLFDASNTPNSGERILEPYVREFLQQEGLKIVAEDAGDICSRHVQYFPRTGRVRVRHLTARSAELGANEQRYLDRLERAPVAGEIDLF